MTYREKLKIEHPECVNERCMGGCTGCPDSYGYADRPVGCKDRRVCSPDRCSMCWDREIPGTAKRGSLKEAIEIYVEHDLDITREMWQFATHTFSYGFIIKKVIFNNPATIVLWSDGTKTVVKCQEGDVYDPEKGLAMAISKKALGNKGNFNEVFKKWLPKETALEKALANLRQTVKKCMSSLTLPSIDIEFRMNKEKENVESEKM